MKRDIRKENYKKLIMGLISMALMFYIWSFIGPARDQLFDHVFGSQLWHYLFY